MALHHPFLVGFLLFMGGLACADEAKPPTVKRPPVADKVVRGAEIKPAGYLVQPPPAWIEPAIETPGLAVDRTSMHYRLIDDQTRVDGRSQETYSHVVRVVDETAGLSVASQIDIDFDPSYQTLVIHRIDVVRDGRRSTRLDRARVRLLQRETQLERRMYDGRETFSLPLDDVRVGDEIDLAYTLRGANPVFGGRFASQDWMTSFRGPVAQYQLRLLTPAARKFQFRPGARDMKVTTRALGPWLETIVRRESVRVFRPEDGSSFQPGLDNQFFSSEYAGWADVASWGRALFAEPAEAMPNVDRKAAEIRAGSDSSPARVLAALEFVQKEIRYFGTEFGANSHRPASPEKVLQQRFGDCKDKVALLLALLRRLDVAGDPYLVSTGMRSKIAGSLPSPLVFDHVIARVTVDGEVYWLDATRSQQSGPLSVRQALGFGQGLLLAADTTAPVAQPSTSGVSRIRVDDQFSIDDFSAPPTLQSRITFYGDIAEAMRDAIANGGMDRLKTQLSQNYARMYPRIRSLEPIAAEEVPAQNAVTLVQRFSVPEFFRFPEQRALVGETAAWLAIDTLRVPNAEARSDPLVISLPGLYFHHIGVTTREDVAKTPSSRQNDSGDAFFALHNQISVTARSFDSTSELTLKGEEISPTEWTAHRTELRKALPTLAFTVVISAIANDKLDAANAEVKALIEKLRTDREKPKTKVQLEARIKAVVLSYQIDSGRLAPPLLAQALTERGVQRDHLAQYELAGADFERALALVPDRKETINAAAVNASARGQTERVITLTSAVLQQSPNDWEALNTRMLTRYMDRDFAEANRDLDTLLRDDSQWRRGYPLIMWSLTHRYLREETAPPDEAAHAAQLSSDWPRPLIDWMRDKIDADAVLRAAKLGSAPAERLCEAYFYMGERYAADGDMRRAAEYYRKALEQGVTEFVENRMAQRRLAATSAR